MTRIALALAGVLAVFVAASGAYAQSEVPSGVFFKQQQGDQYLARDLLLGAKVYNSDGKIIGDIEDLILNEFNQVEGVIMGIGGFLGLGEKRVGVRYSALEFSAKDGRQILTLPQVTKDILKSVPKYVRARPPKSFFEKVTEKAKELAAKTGDTTSDAYKKAKEKAAPALQRAGEKAKEAYTAAKEKVKEAYDKAKEAASPQQ